MARTFDYVRNMKNIAVVHIGYTIPLSEEDDSE